MDFFTQLMFWHWLILVFVLLGLEIMGANGFLLGAAVAAMVMWLLTLVDSSLSWQVQLSIFAALALIFSVVYRFLFNRYNNSTDEPYLNMRSARMIGQELVTEQDMIGKETRQQIGDTRWQLRCVDNLAANTHVRVVGNDGMVLLVEPI